uniref:Uncharacterized protein n=1 Tax=Arundo donax TaxID=35708 RepID=A0A0A9FGH3_ARUDO
MLSSVQRSYKLHRPLRPGKQRLEWTLSKVVGLGKHSVAVLSTDLLVTTTDVCAS